MKTDNYIIRCADSDADCVQLERLYTRVFAPEPVGVMAATMFRHLPGMEKRFWFVAEEKASGQIVSALALLPWQWLWQGTQIKVAEMGIVATDEAHRGHGLQKQLQAAFDRTVKEEGFELVIIQGIPGFYHKFGFHYALPIENHINLAWHQIPDTEGDPGYQFRPATLTDSDFLQSQDQAYQRRYECATYRDADHWRYLLSHSQETDLSSEYWIGEKEGQACFYFRLADNGFGDGQILSECSQDLEYDAYLALLQQANARGLARNKPYLRLNLHNDSQLGQFVQRLGAKAGEPYAWQMKIPDVGAWLKRLKPVLEARIQPTALAHYTGTLRLDSYGLAWDLIWEKGHLQQVQPAEGDSTDGACVPQDLLAAVALGGYNWRELRSTRPDIFAHGDRSALLLDTLFPQVKSWHYMQY